MRQSRRQSSKVSSKKKLEVVSLCRRASCSGTFTPGPAALRNKTYSIGIAPQALTLYDLGYSLNETARRLKSNPAAPSPLPLSRRGSVRTKSTRRSYVFAPKQ